ncbi:hypothetical protein EON64_12490 [archaeon]|nr:MAG: hypothetical protein EON64_12490 [archaeon]
MFVHCLPIDYLNVDEPTNHLDQFAVKWLTDYIINLKTCTCLLVSHDTKFLDNVCTNIIHYEVRKPPYHNQSFIFYVLILFLCMH